MMKPIIDMHCDTLLRCLRGESLAAMDGSHIDLEKLRTGGSLVQCLALFITTNGDQAHYGLGNKTPYEVYRAMLEVFQTQMKENRERIEQVFTSSQIEAGIGKDKLMALLTVEDAAPLEGKYERIDEFFNDGVRIMSLTWNYENCLAWPNDANPILNNTRGLKPFGYCAVERMNELGMLIDVSHLSDRGFWDVASASKKPFVASHSCARRLCSHQRNLTDDQLRALAECGGIVGINFCGEFLENGNRVSSSIESVLRHMQYIKNIAGADTLAWGSDYDGIGEKLEWKDFTGMPVLTDAMSACFTDDEIEKICYKNFIRVLKDNE